MGKIKTPFLKSPGAAVKMIGAAGSRGPLSEHMLQSFVRKGQAASVIHTQSLNC